MICYQEDNILVQNSLSYEIGIKGNDGNFQKILSRNTRFGENSMSIKLPCFPDSNGNLNIYQMFVDNGESKCDISEDVIYMGDFKLLPEKYPSGKICFQLYIDATGKLKGNFYDGGDFRTPVERNKELSS